MCSLAWSTGITLWLAGATSSYSQSQPEPKSKIKYTFTSFYHEKTGFFVSCCYNLSSVTDFFGFLGAACAVKSGGGLSTMADVRACGPAFRATYPSPAPCVHLSWPLAFPLALSFRSVCPASFVGVVRECVRACAWETSIRETSDLVSPPLFVCVCGCVGGRVDAIPFSQAMRIMFNHFFCV